MTTTEARSALAELADLARTRDWEDVSAFLGSFPADDDRGVTVLAGERADAGPLREWIATLDGAPALTSGPLCADGDDDGTATLSPRRVLVVLRCATPLRPSEVTALRTLRRRPAGSYLVVFVNAEAAGSEDELDLLERGIRRSVPTLPSDAVNGPLADRGITLWAAGEPAEAVAARLASDRERITAWVSGDPAGDAGELNRVRADHAVALAQGALAAAGARRDRRDPDAEEARLQRLHARLVQVHSAVLARFDAEAALLQSDVEVAFTAVREELTASVAALVHTGAVDRPEHAGRRVDEHVVVRLRRFEDQQAAEIRRTGTKAVAGGVARLLQGDLVDWDLADGLATLPAGSSYPQYLVEPIAALALATPPPVGPGTTDGPDQLGTARPGSRTPALTALGAVLGLSSMNPLVMLGTATVGLVAGRKWDRMNEADRQGELARAAVARARHIANTYWFAVGQAHTDQVQRVREEIHHRLGALEAALLERAGRPTDDVPSPADDADTATQAALAALQARLDA